MPAATCVEVSELIPSQPEDLADFPPPRNIAVDAFRGLSMILMMAEVLRFSTIAHAYPNSTFWHLLAVNQTHAEWAGLSLHDMIQPAFTFLVGVALPYSIHSRMRRGDSFRAMLLRTLLRSFILIALGVLLRLIPGGQVTFVDTLAQIGLGYTFAFLLAFCRPAWQWTALAALLIGYWLAWALYPVPRIDFNYAAVGVPADWHHQFSGFAAHWNKNSNLGQRFDVWLLNLFPGTRFTYNAGGYVTLNFIPTLGTIILGLRAGEWFRSASPRIPIKRFLIAGMLFAVAGAFLHVTGVCPIVKRVWTPSWTLLSGGLCFLFMALLSWVIDVRHHRQWAFPLIVVGMNSIAAYLIANVWEGFLAERFLRGVQVFGWLSNAMDILLFGCLAMLAYWFILYAMYRRKLFLRI